MTSSPYPECNELCPDGPHWHGPTQMPSPRIRDLEDLVRWLALPYGENRPLFATADWQGKPLDDGKRLEETYLSVVGEKSEPARVGMAWTRCEMCGTFQTIPVEP